MSFLSFLIDEIRSPRVSYNTDGTPMVGDTGVDYEGKPFGMTHEQVYGGYEPEPAHCFTSFDNGISGIGCGGHDPFSF